MKEAGLAKESIPTHSAQEAWVASFISATMTRAVLFLFCFCFVRFKQNVLFLPDLI